MKKDKQRLSEPSKLRETLLFSERKDSDGDRFNNKSPQIYWKDKSGATHKFWIYRRGTRFNEPCPGIYIYARETSPHKWIPIYIRQTENVNVRLTNHEQQKYVDQNGATHIHVSIITDKKSRVAIVKDLIQQWNPVCNAQFEVLAEKMVGAKLDLPVRDEKGEVYGVRYEADNAMWLNEYLKEHRKVQEQDVTIAQLRKDFEATIARQKKQIEVLTAGLQKVKAQFEARRLPANGPTE